MRGCTKVSKGSILGEERGRNWRRMGQKVWSRVQEEISVLGSILLHAGSVQMLYNFLSPPSTLVRTAKIVYNAPMLLVLRVVSFVHATGWIKED